MIRTACTWVLRLLLAFAATDGLSAVRYVNEIGSTPTPPYTDWVTAATSIQDAIDAANPGDEIVVTNGVYKFGGRTARSGSTTNRVALVKPVGLRSVNGPQATLIEGLWDPTDPNGFGINAIRCAYIGTNAIISGFTLTNGNTTHGDHGGAVWCESSAVVTNCIVRGNSAGWQGGGAYGGKIYNCAFIGNFSPWGGGASSATLHNCVLTGNRVGEVGGGAYQCTLYNCTVTGNFAYEWASGVWECAVYNSIVFHNDANGNYVGGRFSNSCTTPLPLAGTGNISSDPLFVDFAGGNLRLQSNSPCINAGSNAYASGSTDLDGRPRVVEGTVDMGAYEFQPGVSGEFLGWLQRYSLPRDGTADTLDSDGDQSNNWQEWRAGTDPAKALSVLRLLTPLQVGSNLVVRWTSVTNRTYFLERSPNLGGQQQFLPMVTGLLGESLMTAYTDTNAVNASNLFYRIGVE